MILYPAIDLKNGKCVRLLRGDMKTAKIFNQDPSAQAKSFETAGSQWLHIVDLNGAIAGRPVNIDVILKILKTVSIPIQLGGGIRDRAMVEMWLEKGIARIILGTTAVRNPSLVRDVCRAHPNQIVIGIDARDGNAAIEGWVESAHIDAIELALRFEDVGAAAIIYTDISRDGAMLGPNINATLSVAKAVKIPVILSGGVSSMDDLQHIKRVAGSYLNGVISGRAIYDGRIDLAAAIAALDADPC